MKTLGMLIAENLIYHELFEMVYDKRDYQYYVSKDIPNLMDHWCLVYYAHHIDKSNIDVHHWEGELSGAIKSVQKRKLSTKNKIEVKEKYITEALVKKMELGDVNIVADYISDKFKTEKTNSSDVMKCASGFVAGLKTLIRILASDMDDTSRYSYIKTI